MGKEVIMLASKYDPKKQQFPAHVSEKYDGVAADFYKTPTGWKVRTRQDKPIKSVQHIIDALNAHAMNWSNGVHVIGELYVPGMDFKDISGLVRRDALAENLLLFVYDQYWEHTLEFNEEISCFAKRLEGMQEIVKDVGEPLVLPPYYIVTSVDDIQEATHNILKINPEAEGIMVRQLHGPESMYVAGKRPRGMAKYKLVETHDLKLVDIEQAIDAKTGEGNGMAGRLVVEYKGKEVGVGPGKLTHAERIDMWKNGAAYIGRTIEVAAMPDKSYEALREPRFIRFRPDKD